MYIICFILFIYLFYRNVIRYGLFSIYFEDIVFRYAIKHFATLQLVV